jgi:hypothetical protein
LVVWQLYQARLREAEEHRLVRQARPGGSDAQAVMVEGRIGRRGGWNGCAPFMAQPKRPPCCPTGVTI